MTDANNRQAWPSALAIVIALCYLSISYISRHDLADKQFIFLTLSGISFVAIFFLGKTFTLNKRTVFAWAVLFHSIGFFGLPLFEDDHYRYLWDGYRSVESGSPYGNAPAEFFSDTHISKPMQHILSGVNNPEVPTLYGPMLQAIFSVGYIISPGNLWPVKLILILANLGLIFLLLKIADAGKVMLYAWNPLVFKEIALTAHPDGLLPLFILIAWLSRDYWRGCLSGFFLGIGLAIKISVLPALMWLFWKRQYSSIFIAMIVLLACYIPFFGLGNDLQGLEVFANEWEFNSGIYALFAAYLPTAYAKLACAGVAGIAMLWIMRRQDAIENPPWHRLFGLLLLFSPVVNAWYLLWFLALAVLHEDCWPWWASAAVLLSYITGQTLNDDTLSAYEMPTWARILEWGLIASAICFDWVKKNTNLLAVHKPQ